MNFNFKILKNFLLKDKSIEFDLDNNELLNFKKKNNKKLIIGTACGRSGLRWISEIHSSHKNCISLIEPFPNHESFFRYSTYNKLQIDHQAFYRVLKYQFIKYWKKFDTIIFSSPWICFGLDELNKNLSPDIYVFVFRDPKKVVNSLVSKGWYKNKIIKVDNKLIPGLQPNQKHFHHNFSRICPNTEYFDKWNNLTPVGKSSWFWSEANNAIWNFIQHLDEEKKLIFKLEDIDQNYDWYLNYANYFKIKDQISSRSFLNLKKKMSNRGKNNISLNDWSMKEISEFNYNTHETNLLLKNFQSNLL